MVPTYGSRISIVQCCYWAYFRVIPPKRWGSCGSIYQFPCIIGWVLLLGEHFNLSSVSASFSSQRKLSDSCGELALGSHQQVQEPRVSGIWEKHQQLCPMVIWQPRMSYLCGPTSPLQTEQHNFSLHVLLRKYAPCLLSFWVAFSNISHMASVLFIQCWLKLSIIHSHKPLSLPVSETPLRF